MGNYTTLRAANIARQIEWQAGRDLPLLFRAVELAGEAGEACNIVKKLVREQLGVRGPRATVDQLADELADVVICTDLVALNIGINLDTAVIAKFNATSEKVGLATRMIAPATTPPRPDHNDLARRVAELEEVLRGYQDWEAAVIMDPACWRTGHCLITDPHYNRMIDLQTRRNAALAGATS